MLHNKDKRFYCSKRNTLVLTSFISSRASSYSKQCNLLSVRGITEKGFVMNFEKEGCSIYLFIFIYCHLYSAFSIVQCSNALYRL